MKQADFRRWRVSTAARLVVQGCIAIAAACGASDVLHAAEGTADHPTAAGNAELQRAARRAELCSASNVAGIGLRGEYFATSQAKGKPLLSRIDGPVDFGPDFEWPAELKGSKPVLVRWSGWLKPVVAGRYRFHADAPGSSVSVSRQPMAGKAAAPDASIELAAGRYYPVEMEWLASASSAQRIRLEWTAPYGARFLVPRTLLYQPTETLPKN